MNRINKNEIIRKAYIQHTTGFNSVHPPGGLIVWPNGITTRIGQRKVNNTGSRQKGAVKKAFIAWPETPAQSLRA
jgi:hypothetical protein